MEERRLLIEDRERFEIKGLEKYILESKMVEKVVSGGRAQDLYRAARAWGSLPHGAVGKCQFERLCTNIKPFVVKTRSYLSPDARSPVNVDVTISGISLTGKVTSIHPKGLVLYRYAKLKPKDHLTTWLNHLVLSVINPDGFTGSSFLIGLDPKKEGDVWTCWEYGPVSKSDALLTSLLEIYWDGLTVPVHFFPRASWEYADYCLERSASEKEALKRALQVWKGNSFRPGSGEKDDVHYQCCFRGTNPLERSFENLALKILSPLMEGRKKVTS